MDLDIVILAAGKGTRMRSATAKVLHELAGRPMIEHVLEAARELSPRHLCLVVGHQADEVRGTVQDEVVWVEQANQQGTGHAVKLALEALPHDGTTLVLYADVPLVSRATLDAAVAAARAGNLGLVTADFDDPAELGRIVRAEDGRIERIVEFKDASADEREIGEINSGILAAPTDRLADWLARVQPNNAQGEYYLTDIIEMAVADGLVVEGVVAKDAAEVTGVNDRIQLAQLERIYQLREAHRLMREGVTMADPARVDIRGKVNAGSDCFVDANVVLVGEVTLGSGVQVGTGCVISDAVLGDNVEVKPHTIIEGAQIADGCALGPFARIRPGTVLDTGVLIGNFVETKKAHLGEGSKASHLAYLGDASIGKGCNIGAGTITCNYDGVDKHLTEIGDEVFVGTNSTLVAPITIESGAFVAAGTTVTVKVGGEELAVGRARQRNIAGWVRPEQRKSKGE